MFSGLIDFLQTTGFTQLTWKMPVMWGVSGVLLWLAVRKRFEPLLLVPIAFGALVANLPTRGIYTDATFTVESRAIIEPAQTDTATTAAPDAELQRNRIERIEGGLYDFIAQGIRLEIFPPLIFLGVGALTDFGPLIAMPRTLLLGAVAQLGLFMTFMGANLLGFTAKQSASIGIIGGADGPTAIFLANKLAPELLGAVAVAAYSYMALVPLIQPPIMRLLTTKKERVIRMHSLRVVS